MVESRVARRRDARSGGFGAVGDSGIRRTPKAQEGPFLSAAVGRSTEIGPRLQGLRWRVPPPDGHDRQTAAPLGEKARYVAWP